MSSLLVIDDERPFGEFVAKVAATIGYETSVAGTAAEFLSSIDRDSPSVIVIDLQMPDMDGIEMLRELGQRQCPSRIVLVSGMDMRTVEAARRLGGELGLRMGGTMQKPVRANQLRTLLSGLRDRSDRVSADALREALDHDRLFLAFQPKIDLRTGSLVAVEALVRWREESGGVILPDEFIPMAEKGALIDDLTDRVIARALVQAAAWRRAGLMLDVAVNLSAKNIHDRQLPDLLDARCRDAKVPPETLVLELTETASTQDSATLLEVLGRFRIKGFKLSIDDFGTGYSSIAQLLKLPFSEMKVDKSFVMEMDRVSESAIIAKTIVDLGHNLGLSVVAEGVENAAILRMLTELGCDLGQGYFFSRPVEPEKIAAMAGTRFSPETS